ncbi:MAG: hypothetical protein K2Q26_07755 [Bdellovibrionales bacterium]|nr:hypothetical protein [Bdellovibrionales bacterium]
MQTAKDINNYVTGYIKVADAKVAGFVAVSTAVSSFILPNLYKWLAETPINGWYYLFWLLLVVGSLALVGTLICALNALAPNAKPAHSLVSFPDIASMTPESYSKAYLALSEKNLINEYLKHNVTLSSVAVGKFKWLKYATKCSYVWAILFVILYVCYAATAIK